MKRKLAKFTAFAERLYPHEVYYLAGIENFQTPENRRIMEVMLHNLDHRSDPLAFDERIDKRKYSNLKRWMEEQLAKADVDQQLLEIQALEARVLLDQVDGPTEKEILKWLKRGDAQHFYFRKIYELAQHYEHFLLIRLRDKVGGQVGDYLNRYRPDFAYSQEVFNKLQQATADIIRQYRNREEKPDRWEDFLKEVVYSEKIDGMNQYAAFIRLSFLYFNYGDYHKLTHLYSFIDQQLRAGRYYSKRILGNYYANRLLYLSRYNNLDEAEQYGYLSIRYKNADYLFYLTNLGAVLFRKGKSATALKLLRDAFPEMRQSTSLHNKIGFVAFYIKCMVDIGKVKDAEAFASTYLKAYARQILRGRWYLFFAAYFRSLILQEKYGRLLYLANRYKLEALDRDNRNISSYLPTISWYISLARFIEVDGDAEGLRANLMASVAGISFDPKRQEQLRQIFEELLPIAPTVLENIKSTLFQSHTNH